MTIKDFQQWTRDTDSATKWDLQTTLQILSHLMEEVGELTQSSNRIHDFRGEVEEKHRGNLKQEVVDVFWFLVKIANRFDVCLESEANALVRRTDTLSIDHYQKQLENGLATVEKEIARAKSELC